MTPYVVPRRPVIVPSLVNAISYSSRISRECTVAKKLSRRSSTSLTGRPVRLESTEAITSSL